MSWSITLIGKPENIVTALQAESEKLQGTSKTEFDNALPHMVGILGQNFNKQPDTSCTVKLTAAGHGYFEGDEQKVSTLSVNVEQLYGTVV